MHPSFYGLGHVRRTATIIAKAAGLGWIMFWSGYVGCNRMVLRESRSTAFEEFQLPSETAGPRPFATCV